METVAWVCEFCNGASGKPRASENSRRCTSNKKPWNCRDALTEARRREREAQGQQGRMKRARVQLQGQPSAYAAIIAEKNIYRIDEVYGVSFFDLDAIREDNVLRNGIEADEREHQYLVRGLFGDSKDDAAKLPGTRWVKLRDIYKTCGVGVATSALEAFDASLVEEMKTARENVVEEIYDDVEEESEVEDDATLGAAG